MPEAPTEPLALEATALRYAARTLTPPETSAFEARLAGDQQARDALAEAVRLSAAAMKQVAPAPSSRLRSIIRARLARRGHPIAWIGLGAGIVAAAALFAVHLADHPSTSDTTVVGTSPAPAIAPEPRVPAAQVAKHEEPEPTADRADDMRKTAEIWAELSTPDHVEKTHDDEARLHHRFKHLRPSTGLDSREP